MPESDPLPLNFNLEPIAPLLRELEWEAEERTLRDSKSKMWPRSLMIAAREQSAGPKPPSGLPKLFPIDHRWKPPRLGSLDALAWGYANTTPLQDAILVWLLWGQGERVVRQAVLRRAQHWPLAPGRRDLIIDTALIHAPALTYNQSPPAWLNYQTEFVNQVNEVLRWIDRELRIARQAISLTKSSKIGAKCDNGSKGAVNRTAPFSGFEQARGSVPILRAGNPVIKYREVNKRGKQLDSVARSEANGWRRVGTDRLPMDSPP